MGHLGLHLGIQYAKAMGLYVCAVDIEENRLALATRRRADAVVDAGAPDMEAAGKKRPPTAEHTARSSRRPRSRRSSKALP